MYSSLLFVSSTHLFILRKLPESKAMAKLVSTHLLSTISKITSKKNVPEIITFRYTTKQEEEKQSPSNCDKVYLPDASDATKNIKMLIVKALNML